MAGFGNEQAGGCSMFTRVPPLPTPTPCSVHGAAPSERPPAPISAGSVARDGDSGQLPAAPSPQGGAIPSRPAAVRLEPPAAADTGEEWGAGWGGGAGGGTSFSLGYGFFPSLFALQFQAVGPDAAARARAGAPLSREEQQQQLVARALFGVGCATMLLLLLL